MAYSIGLEGVVIGQRATYEEALDDVRSAIAFHIETLVGELEQDDPRPLLRLVGRHNLEIGDAE